MNKNVLKEMEGDKDMKSNSGKYDIKTNTMF